MSQTAQSARPDVDREVAALDQLIDLVRAALGPGNGLHLAYIRPTRTGRAGTVVVSVYARNGLVLDVDGAPCQRSRRFDRSGRRLEVEVPIRLVEAAGQRHRREVRTVDDRASVWAFSVVERMLANRLA